MRGENGVAGLIVHNSALKAEAICAGQQSLLHALIEIAHIIIHYREYLRLFACRLLPVLQRRIDLRPQLTRLAQIVGQADICHARFFVARESLKLRNEVLQTECLSSSLRSACLKHDIDNMDVEMIVGRLIWSMSALAGNQNGQKIDSLTMHVKLQLIFLQVRIHFHGSLKHPLPQIL